MAAHPTDPTDPPTPDAEQDDVQEIAAPEQFAALAHPLRQRMLFVLGHHAATVSQLAVHLDTRKGNAAHHLKVLREAGLVRATETRRVRGGTEQYYRRTARRMIVAEPQAEGTAAMLGAVAQELDRAPTDTSHLSLRHLPLSPAKARRLAESLLRLVDEAEPDTDDQPVHGVLVTLYQQADPGGGPS